MNAEWRAQAACFGNPDADRLFFELGNPAPAQRVCAGCPVQQDCYEFATEARIPHGVYGGEAAADRRQRLGISLFEDQVGIITIPSPAHVSEDWWLEVA